MQPQTTYIPLMDNYSSLNNSEEGEQFFGAPGIEQILVPTIFGIVVTVGIFGNLVVLVIVLKTRDHQRHTSSLWMVSLASADLLYLLFCGPFHALIYTGRSWPFGDFMCRAVHVVQFTSMMASVFTLTAMAFDRYLAVTHALATKHMRTPHVAAIVGVSIWMASFVLAAPWGWAYTVKVYHEFDQAFCADDWPYRYMRKAYFMTYFLLGYALPLLLIGGLHALIIRKLWTTTTGIVYNDSRTEQTLLRRRKATRLVMVMVILFCICWAPCHVTWLWTTFHPSSWQYTPAFFYFRISAHILAYMNSALNPIMYAFLAANFRRGFQRVVLGKTIPSTEPRQRYVFNKVHSKSTSERKNGSSDNSGRALIGAHGIPNGQTLSAPVVYYGQRRVNGCVANGSLEEKHVTMKLLKGPRKQLRDERFE